MGNSKTRVHPWVSYLLILSLLGGSLAILSTSPDVEAGIENSAEIHAVRAFFERNPDVDLSTHVAKWIGPEEIQRIRAEHEERREAGSVAVLSPRMRAKTQKRFDALQSAAFESLGELPAWRFGVVKGSSPFANTFMHLATHETAVAIGISVVFVAVAAVTLEGAWGWMLFSGFLLLLPFLSATTYVSFTGDQGVPWIGPSAVIAGLLGAYAVRGLRGFLIPSWVVIPIWVFCEYVLVRDVGADSFDKTPPLVQGVAFALGAVFAGGIWIAKLEELLAHRVDENPDLISNPVLDEALQEQEKGNAEAAFDLLLAELKRQPTNQDVAVALWDAVTGPENGRRAAPTMLRAVQHALRQGRAEDALGLWHGMVALLGIPKADGNLLVRIGEALLAQEEHEPAIEAFSAAVSAPPGASESLSSVLALRVVRSTRDLDPGLASAAAELVLSDAHADVQLGDAERAELEAVRAAAQPAVAAPVRQPAGVEPALREAAEAEPEALDPFQDPHAISEDAFGELPEGESLRGEAEDQSKWNQPGLVEDLSAQLPDDSGFDWDGLPDDAEAGTAEMPAPEVDTSVDLLGEDSSEVTETTETLEPAVPAPASSEPAAPESPLGGRVLRVRVGIPVKLGDDSLSLEMDGAGKTTLPFSRIEAVAAGAVQGLADRPVLVVDLVLNWIDLPDEPLKVIRLRSDGFDPRKLMPGHDSALASLRALLAKLLTSSGGVALPSREAASGNPFETFPSIESYDKDVLQIG